MKAVIASLLALSVLGAATAASAHGWRHHHHRMCHRWHHHNVCHW